MRSISSKTCRPTDVPANTFYLGKLVEDDYVAPVITKWLSQDLGIHFSVTTGLTVFQKIDWMAGTVTSINF